MSTVSYTLAVGANVEWVKLVGTGSINATGNEQDNPYIKGNDANNVLSGLGGDDDLRVRLPDGSVQKAELAGRDPSTDVALLRVPTGDIAEWTQAPVPKAGSLAMVLLWGVIGLVAALRGFRWQPREG